MYIDTHAHIYLEQFEKAYDEVIQRARDAGVHKIFMPNIDIDSLKQVFNLYKKYPSVCYPMVGLHPCSVKQDYKEQLEKLETKIRKEEVIAIGEIGIDLYWDTTFHTEQEEAFREQIRWAKDCALPIVIHSRNSIEHTIRIVGEEQDGRLKGVFHCFGEGEDEARQIIDLGFYLGIGGVITFKKSEALRTVVSKVPLEKILLETDAPYLTPHPHRSKRNESSYIPLIAEVIAQIQNIPIEKVAEVTTENAKRVFGV